MKKNIATNYYPLLLWNMRVFGSKKREITPTNLVVKEADVEFDGSGLVTSVKTDLVESGATKANVFEIVILKYLPIAALVFLLFNINLYYISMVGLFIGSFTYLGFLTIQKRVSAFFAYFFLLCSFFFYFAIIAAFPSESLTYKVNWIVNYALQYFLWLWLFEKVVIDIGMLDFMKWYKVDKFSTRYFKFVDEKPLVSWSSDLIRKIYYGFIVVVMIFALFIGGSDLGMKIVSDMEVKEKILIEDKNERAILQDKNARALKKLIIEQSNELKVKVHTDEDLELLERDFNKYIQNEVIAYELLQITPGSKFVEEDTGEAVEIEFKRPYYLVKSWVKRYKDGAYRWHFAYRGKVLVITNAKARR